VKLRIDPERPQPHQIQRVVELLRGGGVIAYPTDTVYGLGCDMNDRKAIGELYRIKAKDRKSPLSFVCADLKDISRYAIVSDLAFRLMKRILPGPYTIVLKATKLVPSVMLNDQRTVGIRIPDHPVAREIVEALGNPIVTTSVPIPDDVIYNDPYEIDDRLGHALALVVDCDIIFPSPSTILDLSDATPRLLRAGKGDLTKLGGVELIEDIGGTGSDIDE
jgi:tRNA threonylcarbamoyl adenosine modification protein (Sua5/YciO/YrdC/YwlC family)